jgi:putative hydrolase of the HAD superfamily
MTELEFPIECIAIDFGGTLASRSGAAVDGSAVASVLRTVDKWTTHPGFAETLNRAMKSGHEADRRSLRQTPFASVLQSAARACGALLPDEVHHAAAGLFEHLPDARIDEQAARAVEVLAERGFRLVLASNTRWPETARRRTLRAAGIEHCFHAVVLSSELRVRKPHGEFYQAVLGEAGCPANRVLFVGDTADKDVDAPRRHGMQAMLVASVWDRFTRSGRCLPLFEDIPRLLGVAEQ